jgi:hypothetical protein
VHQHRLGLVIGVVTHSYLAGTALTSYPAQESIADTSRRLLEGQPVSAGQRWHILSLDSAWQPPGSGQVGDISSIGVSVGAARTVMEVGHVKAELVRLAQTYQNVEQRE